MNQATDLFLALDQSTSATKSLLFSMDGRVVDQESVPHQQIYPRAGWVEHDAEEIFLNTLKSVSSLLKRHVNQRSRILSLSITNQRETFVLFDRITGHPLHSAIVWQCRRGAEICARLVQDGKEELVSRKTGLKLDTYFPASKLRWLLDSRPDLAERLHNGSALFGTIDTYLIYRLTKGAVYATDYTNASRTLFFDISELAWSQDLCGLFGIASSFLPEVRESAAWYGDTDIHGIMDRNIPIYGVMGDSQAALFAQRCFEPGSAKVTFGTGSSILLNIGQSKRDPMGGSVTALGWVLNGKPVYAFEGIINFTGATIAWLRDQMGLIEKASDTEKLALSIPDSDGVYFIPAFIGLSAPYWRSDVRAAILGLSPSTTRAHVARAALESIGYMVTDTLKAMIEGGKVQLSTISADGGATSNQFLMQFVSDINQIKVKAASTAELSALGAVYSGCFGLNIFSSLSDLERISMGFVEYAPKMDKGQADKLFTGWQKAVQQVLIQPK